MFWTQDCAPVTEIPQRHPGELGLDPDRLERARELLQQAIAHGAFPGAVALAIVVALVFQRIGGKHPTAPVQFRPALVASLVGVGAHLLVVDGTRLGPQPLTR